jgi:hypothetical protein
MAGWEGTELWRESAGPDEREKERTTDILD